MTRHLPLLLLLAACSGNWGYSPSLTMVRTGVEIEEDVHVPEALYIPGINIKPEDYDYAAGKMAVALDLNNMRDLEDPEPLEKHASYDYEAGAGELLDALEGEGAMEYTDVEQGAIGDCFFPAALAATIFIDEDHAIREGLIREVKDKDGMVTHFVVRFYDAWGEPQDIEVDADLVRKNGRITYARSTDTRSGNEEWWVSLVEKAYAQWHGGYQEIGEGGWVGDVMQALTGSNANYRKIKYLSDSTIITSITNNIDRNRPVAAGTWGEDDGVDYSGTNIYAFHAYSILGAGEKEDGTRYVTLRNPWASVEPAGNGADDGIFDLELDEFKRLYQGLTLGGDYTVDHEAPDAVDDLSGSVDETGAVVLTFTATGDDGDEGLASAYDLRASKQSITSSNFYSAERLSLGGPQLPGTQEELTLTDLGDGGTWYLALKVEDESGNISEISNVVVVDTEPGDDTPPIPYEYFEEFEGDTSGWATSGLFHLTGEHSLSGSHAFWCGDESTGDYSVGDRAEGVLMSPKLDLTGVQSPVILWEQILDVEGDADHDLAVVEVATEESSFSSWSVVWEKESTSTFFDLMMASLDGYEGQIVRVRWRFDSVDDGQNDGTGWVIDDVWFTDY